MAASDPHERLTAALRVAVASAALAIFVADPDEHPARRPFATASFAMFAAYGAVSYLVLVRRGRGVPGPIAPWIDAAWVMLAVAVSQATSEIFYPLCLFAILSASFRGGFRPGFAVAAAIALSYAAVGGVSAPPGTDLRMFVVRPLYLLVLGYVTAVWGDHEVRSRARLALLRDVTALSGPRAGLEPTLGRILEAVRAFFDADSCRIVIADERTGRTWTRAAVRGRGADASATHLPPELGQALLPPPQDASLIVREGRRGAASSVLHGSASATGLDPAVASALLTAVEAGALLSLPFRYHASAAGRLYVARTASRPFDAGDADFLRQVVDQLLPVLENLRLVDRLAADAAVDERRRIARDLHDSVIQPYLGLRLGLSAAGEALRAGRPEEARGHVDRLVRLADEEIGTLRGYVRELRSDGSGEHGALESSLRRFCRRFSEATGIRVDVASEGGAVPESLASDVFQMVAEALSNVRRHTGAARAEVRIGVADRVLRVVVANDGAPAEPIGFFPRSLAERAAALGGHVTVQHPAPRTTAVRVEVPV
jgi:signal transduction histidine kinase